MQIDVIGYLAASLVLATFWMRSMSRLRSIAIASNLAFIAYGYIGELMPVLLLHLLLLPVNVLRLSELGSIREHLGPSDRRRGAEPIEKKSP
jgi:hypothetical protein